MVLVKSAVISERDTSQVSRWVAANPQLYREKSQDFSYNLVAFKLYWRAWQAHGALFPYKGALRSEHTAPPFRFAAQPLLRGDTALFLITQNFTDEHEKVLMQ